MEYVNSLAAGENSLARCRFFPGARRHFESEFPDALGSIREKRGSATLYFFSKNAFVRIPAAGSPVLTICISPSSERKPLLRKTLAQNIKEQYMLVCMALFFRCVMCAESVYWEHHGECGWPRAHCLPLQVICKDLLHVTPSMYNPSRCHISATLFTHGCCKKSSQKLPPGVSLAVSNNIIFQVSLDEDRFYLTLFYVYLSQDRR